jgi:2-dehydro-3-deoxygluconokinase
MTLTIRPAAECRYDIVALGEVMLRLDPGEGRVRTTRRFDVYEGGGEYNVARGLRRAFGQRAAIISALVDNEVGHLIEDLILTGGVDTTYLRWRPHDGIGAAVRNGLNFTERGFGVRGALGVSDRGHTAASQMQPGDVDVEDIFDRQGVRWLHTGGIYAGLSDATAQTALAVIAAARAHGTVVSYDLNYRPSLWQSRGGQPAAQQVNREIAQHVDVLIGNEEDFTACLGYDIAGVNANLSSLPTDSYAAVIARAAADHPQLQVIATTLRTVHTATRNDWGALAWSPDTGLTQATQRDGLEILDRVGGGDSFASGLIYGLLDGQDLPTALEYGAAHGALAMTTPGDTSMATRAEVIRLATGGNARVAR